NGGVRSVGRNCGDRVLFSCALARRRWVVRPVDVRVLDQDQKGELCCMGDNRNEQNFVTCCHQRNTVEASVADGIHGVWGHLEDAVKGQLSLEEVEEITPVPSIVFYHTMGI